MKGVTYIPTVVPDVECHKEQWRVEGKASQEMTPVLRPDTGGVSLGGHRRPEGVTQRLARPKARGEAGAGSCRAA